MLHGLLETHPAEALRYALLTAHYRQPLDWTDGLIEQSVKTLDGLYRTLDQLSSYDVSANAIPVSVEDALCNDLNTPIALSAVNELASLARHIIVNTKGGLGNAEHAELSNIKSDLLAAGAALGLLQQDPTAWFARGNDNSDDARIQALVDERNTAKKEKNFARSDAIRDQLAAEGILLEDTAQGVRWRRA